MFYIYANGQSIYQPPEENCTLISPRLTLEMGKAGSLEFSVPPTHKAYNELRQLKTLVTVELDDVEIFRGRILSNERDFNNVRKIYCEGDLAYLVDTVQKSEKYNGTTHDLFRKIVAAHNARVETDKQFTVGQITIENRSIILTGQSDQTEDPDTGDFDYKQIAINSISNEWKTTYDYIETCLIDYCGGYLRTRRVGNTTYLDLIADYGNKAPQEIEFGVNMLDLTEEASAEELFTVLIPLGDENLTIESVNNGSDELVDTAGVAAYGRIVKTQVFDNVNQASTLLENGRRFLASHANIPVTITVRAVDMHLVERGIREIYVGDVVHVNSYPHSIVQDLTCTKLEYDIENPANNTYTFGNPKQSLTERYRKDKAIAADKATGSGGGGGSGAAGAAGAAGEKKAKELLDRFYDAWINVDPEAAHIDLGAVYRELKDTKTVLENQVGIDLDAVEGNINIRALKTKYDELENVTRQQAATIDLLTSDTESKIELLTSFVDKVEATESAHYASIVLRANALESAIELKADRVDVQAMNINLNALVTRVEGTESDLKGAQTNISAIFERVDANDKAIRNNQARIDLVANDLGARITLETKDINDNLASIRLSVSKNESDITLKADKVTVSSMDVRIGTLGDQIKIANGEISNVKSLVTKKLDADDLSAKIAAIVTLTTKNIVNKGYLHTSGNTIIDGNCTVYGTLSIAGAYVATKGDISGMATQKWVTDQLKNISVAWSKITGKPSYFPVAKHRHTFSGSQKIANGHTHKYTQNGKTYYTAGIYNGTNATHNVSISGNTGYTGG